MARRSWLAFQLLRVLWSFMGAGQEEVGSMSRTAHVRAPTSSMHATGLSRRKKSAHGISGKKIYFSGLKLPKWPSFHELPLATIKLVSVAEQPSFLCTGEALGESKCHRSIPSFT